MEYPEDIEIQKLDAEDQRITSATADVQTKAFEARERLLDLRPQLGETILRAALGEARDADVNAARFAVLAAEREIEAGNLIIEPARRAQVRNAGEQQKLTRRRGYRRDIDELKNKITEARSATETEIARLHDLAAVVGMDRAEIQTFLEKLKPQAVIGETTMKCLHNGGAPCQQ